MAVVRISDIIVPTPFSQYTQRAITEKNAFVQSGVIGRDPRLSAQLLTAGGDVLTMPSFNALDTSVEENSGNDDPLDVAVPEKLGTGQERTPRINRNQSWSEMDLARILAGANPLDAVANHIANYFLTRRQVHTLAIATMMVDDSVANHASDMVVDIYSATPVAATNNLNTVAVNAAAHTSGDAFDNYDVIAIHSATHQKLVDADQITFIPASEGKPAISIYLGRIVIVDDALPVVDPGGGDPLQFTSYLFGAAVFAMEDEAPTVPTEIEREGQTGNGQGQDTIIRRVQYALHPNGYRWLGDTLGTPISNPSNAESASILSWQRSANMDRKLIKFAAVIHNNV